VFNIGSDLLDANSPGGGAFDTDGDGFTDDDENNNGFDPNDPNDPNAWAPQRPKPRT
jgi:hypothetical protein|tara:strand:+ start:378 stop:548 length:171 start_codon:yes stop_codon:yes gene_type:complete